MQGFNVRVYGIMFNEQKQVLVTDEFIKGGYFTKFPGGGLEFGEGTLQCVVREFQEELGLDVEVVEHIYTTDFFQISAFGDGSQIISIYYLVKPLAPFNFPLLDKPFGFDVPEGALEVEGARWINWEEFSAEAVTLPIDKVVADLVKVRY
ncbi:NUDIX hydrolase [Chitinophaga pinensis]|uniref:NUDIX hydrolase n=1 Tax=Chitinophaga pinensis (strain ATCC 43595 / DSM 2588 / LMG 13176 / NBRC 15968 / NCIMB 11800 / UQM 2034) TaxID=485918 RepID=A0A979GTJ9_CHIPD|nr:NUDIX domain-containing protein [Chitinophaga pinensis]ACU62133.1 NUDIX hydrolase [Chitinophaga pinensis DSM 2588]